MELVATNGSCTEQTFENVIGLVRDDGDLKVHINIGDGATKWETVVDGQVERLK